MFSQNGKGTVALYPQFKQKVRIKKVKQPTLSSNAILNQILNEPDEEELFLSTLNT